MGLAHCCLSCFSGGGGGGSGGGGGGGSSGGVGTPTDGWGGYAPGGQENDPENFAATMEALTKQAEAAAAEVLFQSQPSLGSEADDLALGLDLGSMKRYSVLRDTVARQVSQLRVILESVEAREKQREWLRHQAYGDLDDAKLVDGVAGDKHVYKRRGEPEQQMGLLQQKPVRFPAKSCVVCLSTLSML